MSFTGPSLRDRLRTGTRTAQEALERAQRQFDLSEAAGLAAFLRAQRDALASLHPAAPDLTDPLTTARARLKTDLAALGCTAPATHHPRPKADDRRGLGYIWHSQQLALRMLSKRLPDAETPARAFITAPRDVTAWRQFCDEIEHVPGYGPDGDAALRTANDWLAFFETIHLMQARADG